MKFTTLTFLVFFVLVFLGHWTLSGRRTRNWLLVLASYAFYSWWDYRFSSLLMISSLADFAIGLELERTSIDRRRRALLLTSIAVNLGLLGYFKYANFFIDSAVVLANSLGWQVTPVRLAIILPIGISFYTFQTLSYSIDVYRRRVRATRDLSAYLAYVSFFPQLVAGPIERATHLLPQFIRDRSFDEDLARDGLRQMLWGFVKKLLVADRVGEFVNFAYGAPASYDGPELLFATLCFSVQVYCDFSAYSDIAIGCARLFGIDLSRNFAYPFFSLSLNELWRRWHISLMSWLRDYVYVPLGGGRAGRLSALRNVMITFTLSGLWHGAGMNFVVWGALHGLFVCIELQLGFASRLGPETTPGGEGRVPSATAVSRMLLTFVMFAIGNTFVRAESVGDGILILSTIAQSNPLEVFAVGLAPQHRSSTAVSIALILLEWTTRRYPHPFQLQWLPKPVRWLVYTLVIWVTLAMLPTYPHEFIYFQF